MKDKVGVKGCSCEGSRGKEVSVGAEQLGAYHAAIHTAPLNPFTNIHMSLEGGKSTTQKSELSNVSSLINRKFKEI